MASKITLGAVTISGGRPVLGPDGTGYSYTKISGWDDPPGLRMESTERAGGHGSTASRGWLGPRTVVIEGFVYCKSGDPAKLREAVDRLMAAIPLGLDSPLVFVEPGITRHLMVRQGGQPMVDRIGRKVGRHVVATFNIQLLALDPRRLSGSGPATVSVPLPFGVSVAIPTGGRVEAPVFVELVGPINAGAKIESGGRTLTIGAALTAGQKLTLNLEHRKAMLGGSDIGHQLSGLWPAPAINRSIKITASGSGSATAKAWEAWA